MKLSSQRYQLPALLLAATVIQAVTVWWGLDVCDTGYYMTFYANLPDAPQSVSHNFMYWLSGVVGAAWLQLFPDAGVTGIRVLGLLCNLVAVTGVWTVCRRTVPPGCTMLAVVMLLTGYLSMPMAFYNDTLTATMIVVAMALMLAGLRRDSRWLLVASGIVLGVNVLTRVPNILDVAMAGIVAVHGAVYGKSRRWTAARCAAVVAGFAVGLAATLGAMAAVGHLDLWLGTLRDLAGTAADAGQSHGAMSLIMAQVRAWTAVMRAGVHLLLVAMLYAVSRAFIRWRAVRWIFYGVAVCLLYCRAMATPAVILLTAVAAAGCVATFFMQSMAHCRVLAAAGLAMMLIMPLGSDGAMINNGSIILWLAMPVALMALGRARRGLWALMPRAVAVGGATVSAAFVAAFMAGGAYFDPSPVGGAHATVAGMTTSARRAAVVTELVGMVERNVEPGSELMVYGSAPMVNYLTATRPWGGCSWPELLSESQLQSRLDATPAGSLPAVLVQHFDTLGAIEWTPGQAAENTHHTPAKSQLIADFLTRHRYRIAASSPWATLYLPAN